MQNDSDVDDVSHPPVYGRLSSQETISGAGRALNDVAGYTELNRCMTWGPLNPCASADDFNWAS